MSKFNLTVRADVYVPFMYSISMECNGTPSFFFNTWNPWNSSHEKLSILFISCFFFFHDFIPTNMEHFHVMAMQWKPPFVLLQYSIKFHHIPFNLINITIKVHLSLAPLLLICHIMGDLKKPHCGSYASDSIIVNVKDINFYTDIFNAFIVVSYALFSLVSKGVIHMWPVKLWPLYTCISHAVIYQ